MLTKIEMESLWNSRALGVLKTERESAKTKYKNKEKVDIKFNTKFELKNPKTLLSKSYIMDKKDNPAFDMDVMKECERLLAEYREGNKSSIYILNEFEVSIVPIVANREIYNG